MWSSMEISLRAFLSSAVQHFFCNRLIIMLTKYKLKLKLVYSKKNLEWLVSAFFGWNRRIEQIGPVPADYCFFSSKPLVLDKSLPLRKNILFLNSFFSHTFSNFDEVFLQNSDLILIPPLLPLSFKSSHSLPSLYCKAFFKAV